MDKEEGAGAERRGRSTVGLAREVESDRGAVVEGTSDSGSLFSRRRTLGEGPSGFSDGKGGPFMNAATFFDAESYVRRPSSSSRRRLPLVEASAELEPALPLPLLPLGAVSRREVYPPS